MTVSNKCLLIFFQGLCAAEFVVKLGVGILPCGRPPLAAGEAGLQVPACIAVRPCGTCSSRGAPRGARRKAPNYDSRRPVRPAPEACPAAGGPRRGLRAPWRRPQPLLTRPACLRRPLRPETGPTGRRRGARPRARTGRRGAPSTGWGPRTPPRVCCGRGRPREPEPPPAVPWGAGLRAGATTTSWIWTREGCRRPRWAGPRGLAGPAARGREVRLCVHRRAGVARGDGPVGGPAG